jgi:hypothetical protein
MPVYKAPVDEVLFLLNDVFQISRYNNLPGFADASPDLIEPILAEAAKLCEQVVQPLNLPGDREGCTRHDDGSVTTPKGFRDATICEGGWMRFGPPGFSWPGSAEPMTTTPTRCSRPPACGSHVSGPAQGAIARSCAAVARAEAALPGMVAGPTGTMNQLTALRHRSACAWAVKQASSYKIAAPRYSHLGEEHPTENIIHLVLRASRARLVPRANRCSSCRNSCPSLTAPGALTSHLRLDREKMGTTQLDLRDEL